MIMFSQALARLRFFPGLAPFAVPIRHTSVSGSRHAADTADDVCLMYLEGADFSGPSHLWVHEPARGPCFNHDKLQALPATPIRPDLMGDFAIPCPGSGHLPTGGSLSSFDPRRPWPYSKRLYFSAESRVPT